MGTIARRHGTGGRHRGGNDDVQPYWRMVAVTTTCAKGIQVCI